MSTAAARVPEAPPSKVWLRPFTVAEYHDMIRHGILTEDERVELLDGWVVKKMAHNPPHDAAIGRLQRRIGARLPDDWLIRVQCAVTLKDSEPEPDIAIVTGPEEEYDTRHPGGSDVGMLIEVSDSSVEEDREVKGPIYARARIPIYWIVNIPEQQIEVYTGSRGGKTPGYRRRQDIGFGDSVPLVLGTKVLAHLPVRQLIPRPETQT